MREIPKKNYYIVAIVSIIVIALTLWVRVLYLNYVNNKVENGIFYNKAINQINTDDFDTDAIEWGTIEQGVIERKRY